MVPLETVFLGLVLFFAIIGALRGWAKELLVIFSVVLARFIEFVALVYVPVLSTSLQSLQQTDPKTWFYVRLIIFGILVAVSRLPDLGAPIRYFSIGVKYELDKTTGALMTAAEQPEYYQKYGMLISFIAILGLAFGCYLLASWGAKGTIKEEDAMDATAGGGTQDA